MDEASISSERVRLTPFSKRHLTAEYVAWLNDPTLMRYSEQRHREHTLASCKAYWEGFRGTPHHFWAIEAVDLGGLHIGNLNAYVDANNSLADMGILIGHASAQRKGYGLLAWKAALAHLMRAEAVRKVTAGTMATNAGMNRLAQRSGMREDGRRSRHYICDGQEVDIVYWAAFAPYAG